MEILGLQLHFTVLWWVIGIALVMLAIGITLMRRGSHFWEEAGIFLAILGGIALVISGPAQAISAIPYDSKYWHLYTVSGEVETVTASFNVDGGDITNNYILTLDGDARAYRLTDPRIQNASGPIDLTCSIEWVYQGADRYNCYIR